MNEHHLITFAQEVIFGAESFARLAEAVEPYGWQRLVLCTSPSLRRAGHVAALQATLGQKLVATYDHVQPHVQDFQLAEALAIAHEYQAEAILGLGGGSPIGMAKAISSELEALHTGHPARAAFPTEQPLVPVIAIPTTYAGSEMTPIYGVTHTSQGAPHKATVRDPKVAPKLVIYDPLLTLDLPPRMTASSGINALAHCVEALYSITRNPLASAAAQAGIEHITRALPRCTADGQDRQAREDMLVGSHLAALALSTTSMGLHHGLCHVLGGNANVPHGIANSVILPHAMRFNLEVAAPQLALVARSMGLQANGQGDQAAAEAAIDGIYTFIGQLELPQHLQQAGLAEDDLPRLAGLALHSRAVQDNPRPVTTAALAEAVLRAAW